MRRPRDGFFLRAESYYNVATEVERLDEDPSAALLSSPSRIDGYGGRSLHEQSQGESFLALFMDRLRGDGLYILDEPEAALSPTHQLALLARLHDLVRIRSQFLIAAHSPILLAHPDANILLLDEHGTRQVPYEEAEHFVMTRRFLNDHRAMLARLLE
ncbi:MAG: hypothetical protein ACREON_15055 [Gemmatimonadaceae bacterium]